MYTLYGQNFIAMIKSFYPEAKIASGGKEVVIRCRACGDSSNSRHAHLYISVPQSADEVALYQCKKCSNHGIVDDIFLRQYGCEDSRILIDIVSHNNELKKNPKYSILRSMSIYPLRNTFISNQPWNTMKLSYINSRIGSNFAFEDLSKLKIFLNLYDVLNQNRLVTTRHKMVTDALNEHFIGFISYDNSYCVMRKIDNSELYKTLNKRYINYNIINKFDSTKDFYVIPTTLDTLNPNPVRIHIAEGVFDILSIYYNLNRCNNFQNVYISASGKSYAQALKFILSETGIINYTVELYPDNDVPDVELNRLITQSIRMLACDIIIHRNNYPNEKDYGVPVSSIIDTIRVIKEPNV